MKNALFDQVADLIGNTPTVRLHRLSPPGGAKLLGKLEFLNPGGSVKDRLALNLIRDAERSGRLKRGMTIVEATSGNTGIGLAMLCSRFNYRLMLTMPETMSFERRALVSRYGAEVVLTPGDKDMAGAVQKARELVARNTDFMELRQFENPANPEIHRLTTGPEILEATQGNIAAFVAGVGTGGTITGAGEVLKAALPNIQIVAVEPARSAVLSGQPAGPHAIEGIGAGFVPTILNRDIIDEVITVGDRQAFEMSEALASQESLMVGISSGAAVVAAQKVAARMKPDQQVVTILCDTGSRYFSLEEFFRQEKETHSGVLW